jgi:hypothetical protein
MTTRTTLSLIFTSVLLVGGTLPALAHAESAQIQTPPPSGPVNPGTTVNFSVASSGFVDPKYSVSDSFSGSGGSAGSIDVIGFFSWTPNVYDAGRHTFTVTVTDSLNHTATTTTSVLVASNNVILGNPSPGSTITVGRTVTFTAVAPGFITPSFTVHDTSALSSINNSNISGAGVFSWTPSADDIGVHTLNVGASDIYGHIAQNALSLTVIQPTVSIQALKPNSGPSVGSVVSFLAQGFVGASSYSVSDAFTGTSTISNSNITTGGMFSWVPTASDIGFHTLTVTSGDTYGNSASTTLMLVVTPTLAASACRSKPYCIAQGA